MNQRNWKKLQLGLWGTGLTLLLATLIIFHQSSTDAHHHSERISTTSIVEQYQNVISFWTKKLAADPYSYRSRSNIARAKVGLARTIGEVELYHEAEELVLAAIELAPPRDRELQLQLASIFTSQHRFQEAYNIADTLYRANPTPEILAVRGDAALGQGLHDRALADYQRYATERPGFSSWTRYAHILELLGQHDKAVELLVRARDRYRGVEVEPAAWIRFRIGLHYLNRGNAVAAKRHFRDALKVVPDYYLAERYLSDPHYHRDHTHHMLH